MNKVWIVEMHEQWEGSWIVKVFNNKQLAENYKAKANKNNTKDSIIHATISEFKVEDKNE